MYIFNFGYLSPGHYIYVSKDVRIRGYFTKPKGVRKQKSLGNTALQHRSHLKMLLISAINNSCFLMKFDFPKL
jgi:hypothetical protein